MAAPTAEERISKLESQIEALVEKNTELESQIESLTEKVKTIAASGEVSIEPEKPTKPLAECTFTHEKVKYGFNFPSFSLDNGKGVFVPYTAEEICAKENASLQAKLVAMYLEGDMSLLTEVK